MTLEAVYIDTETDGLDYTKLHCCAVAWEAMGEPKCRLFTDAAELKKWLLGNTNEKTIWVGQNILGFDIDVLRDLVGLDIDPQKVLDTAVLSRLMYYNRFTRHSLKELSEAAGSWKGEYTGGWDTYTKAMGDYCKQDALALIHIVKMLSPSNCATNAVRSGMRRAGYATEAAMALLCKKIQKDGFPFDKELATRLLREVKAEMHTLEKEMQKQWPPQKVLDRTIQWREKQDGTPYATVLKAQATAATWRKVRRGGQWYLDVYEYKEFKPGSPKQRIKKLWDAGWEPYDKTLGHIKWEREKRKGVKDAEKDKKFSYYGWKCNEDNLATLPATAPQAAQDLAEWLTLEGRRSSLAEWLGQVGDDGKIHGKLWHIGAWTHRMAHSSPNTANIASIFEGVADTPVKKVKKKYDERMRECWKADDNAWLVGCDADGIQLRILAHYMNSPDYINAIVSGDKALGTDIHSVNLKALGLSGLVRDDAKTFIYAWLLGAGTAKIASILHCNNASARIAVDSFLNSLPKLKQLKENQIPQIAAKGFFCGFDGRRVNVPSEHHTLAGMLQAGEAIIMKRANLLWQRNANRAGIRFKQVNFVHDEWQTIVYGGKGQAHLLGKMQQAALEEVGRNLYMNIPITGSYKIGHNWKETH